MMKKILICLLLILCLLPVQVFALDVDRDCSLTIHYGTEGVQARLYRVAQANQDGSFSLIAPFDSWHVNISGITSQNEWNAAAETLESYILVNKTRPDYEKTADAQGDVALTGLKTGLYLVLTPQMDNRVYEGFLIHLPNPNTDTYHQEVKPKSDTVEPPPEYANYSLVKLWKDAGHTKSRPQTVTVDILKDGQLFATVNLSEDTAWSYHWTTETGGVWTVAERDVPDAYTVTVSANATAFTITNTYKTPPVPEIPKTGDIFPLTLWVIVMSLSGIALLLLGILAWRRNKHEQGK